MCVAIHWPTARRGLLLRVATVALTGLILVLITAACGPTADDELDAQFQATFHDFCMKNLEAIASDLTVMTRAAGVSGAARDTVRSYVEGAVLGFEACNIWYDPSHSRWSESDPIYEPGRY